MCLPRPDRQSQTHESCHGPTQSNRCQLRPVCNILTSQPTIVGFYFGAEIGKGAEETLRIASIHLSSDTVAPNTKFKFTTVVSGGEPAYQFGVGLDQEPAEMTGHVGEGGWIEMEVTAPQLVDNKEKTVQVELQVLDANGHMGRQSTKITVKPSP
jgi:hypothetical protein